VISAVAALLAAVVLVRRSGGTLRGQVGDVLPHPHLRVSRAEPEVPAAEPAVPIEVAAPAESVEDPDLLERAVTDRRRAS
jgi:hypothetical protein